MNRVVGSIGILVKLYILPLQNEDKNCSSHLNKKALREPLIEIASTQEDKMASHCQIDMYLYPSWSFVKKEETAVGRPRFKLLGMIRKWEFSMSQRSSHSRS